MGFLHGKRALITGILSQRSIAWGIANAMHAKVRNSFTSNDDAVASTSGNALARTSYCHAISQRRESKLFADLGKHWDGIKHHVHSIGFARASLQGEYRADSRAMPSLSRTTFPATASPRWPRQRDR